MHDIRYSQFLFALSDVIQSTWRKLFLNNALCLSALTIDVCWPNAALGIFKISQLRWHAFLIKKGTCWILEVSGANYNNGVVNPYYQSNQALILNRII